MMNKHLFFALFLCLTVTAFSQPAITTQQLAGGSADDKPYSMSLTPDGGYITGGFSVSGISGDKTQSNRGEEDYWIVKYNKAGKIQWNKTYGGNYVEELRAIKPTKDGGYIVGGTSGSGISGDKTVANKGGFDYWILKLDKAGNLQWQKGIGGNGDDYVTDAQQTSDGGYIIGGWSKSNISGDKTENSRGDADYWVVKLDSSGAIQWQKTIGGGSHDNLAAIQQTTDGGYITGGTSGSGISGDKTEANKGKDDYWVVKLNSTGAIQWQKTIGGSGEDVMYAIQQAAGGGYIMGGTSASGISGNKTEANKGVYDYWVLKLNGSGAIQWQKDIGGSDDDEMTTLDQTKDGGYILGGFSISGISYDKTENSHDYDYWVVKTDGNGTVQWDKTIGGNFYDAPYSVKEVKANYYNVTGYSYSPVSADKTLPSKGGADFWMVQLKYSPVAGTSAEPAINTNKTIPLLTGASTFRVYPNPAKDVLHVETAVAATLTITNETGKQVINQRVLGKDDIRISQLPAGIYYLKNTATNEIKKIVIMQ